MAKIEVNDSNFEQEVIEKSKEIPVIVDFWAPWCAPCVMLGPLIEKVAEENEGKVVLAKMNVDENPLKSQEYGIMSIPNVKMFKDGKIVSEFVGLMPEDAIRQWINENIN